MSYLCSFVHVTIFVHKLVVMSSMSGIVQLALMTSLAVWGNIEIYTDTVGFEVTLELTQIEVDDFYSFNDMLHETSVTKLVVDWERELTTFSLKNKKSFSFFFFFLNSSEVKIEQRNLVKYKKKKNKIIKIKRAK